MRWLFPGSEVQIDTRWLDCGQPIRIRIRIRMKDDEILEIDPPTAVGHMNAALAKLFTGEITIGNF